MITQKTKPQKSTIKNDKESRADEFLDPETKKFKEGNPGGGRPEGTKNFSTLMDEAVDEIAKANKITKSEVWQILIKRGYSEAKDGNYPFYKDLLDRYFGKAHDVFEGDPNNPLIVEISEIIAKKRGIKRNENKKE